MEKLKYLEVLPEQKADACVIWLHGLGADGYDFSDVIPNLQLPNDHRIQFVFPHAPHIPITLNAGVVMPGWYDILGLTLDTPQDEAGIKHSAAMLHQLMQDVVSSGIAFNRIVLIGFSQGGALALYTALRYPKTLGGVAGLSTYLPLDRSLAAEKDQANDAIPIFLAHGLADPVVPYVMGLHAHQCLMQQEYPVSWHTYPIPHTVCLPELADIGQWLKTILLNYGNER